METLVLSNIPDKHLNSIYKNDQNKCTVANQNQSMTHIVYVMGKNNTVHEVNLYSTAIYMLNKYTDKHTNG